MLGRIILSIVLLLGQALLFNHIRFEGYGLPMVCVYVIVIRSLGTSRIELLLWAFVMGVLQDMFAGTPGQNAASLTLVALVQPWVLKMCASGDFLSDELAPAPSARSLGWRTFAGYAFVLVLIQQAVVYLLDYFGFEQPIELGLHILAGTVCSLLCLLAFEGLRRPARDTE